MLNVVLIRICPQFLIVRLPRVLYSFPKNIVKKRQYGTELFKHLVETDYLK